MNEYRQHWWKCNGPCQHRPPYYGLVKRAMNRPPSSKDSWWSKHQETCGGTYIKIKEPDDYKKKGKVNEEENSKTPQNKNADIKKLLENRSNAGNSGLKQSVQKTDVGFSGKGHVLGGMKQEVLSKKFSKPSEAAASAAQKRHSQTIDSSTNKRMKESSKGKEQYKELTKIDKSFTLNKHSTSPSKTTTANKDISGSLIKGSMFSKTTRISTSDSLPCSSSSTIIQEQCDDVIDLTDDHACPICGFTSQKADLLSTHINECLIRFTS